MKRIVLFFLSFLTLWLGGANPAWAQEDSGGESGSTTTTSGFWTDFKATEFEHIEPAHKRLMINSEAELALFAYIVVENATDLLYEPWRTGFEGWTVNLTKDLDMSAHYWKPITFAQPFRGTFSAGRNTIRGIKVDAKQINEDNMSDPARMTRNGFGLFAEVEGTVQNLNIAESSFYLEETRVSTKGNYLGAICGKLRDGGSVRNCTVGSDVTVEGINYIGGLVGLVGTSDTNAALATIVGCVNSAKVKGVNYVGGIAGEVEGNASVRYCLYNGTGVTGTNVKGLLIGNNRSTVTDENKVEKNYYLDTNNTLSALNADDRLAYTVSYKASNTNELDESPWLALDFGSGTDYLNSGITAYEHILKYTWRDENNTEHQEFYAGKDETVVFGLNINNAERGKYINNVRVNDDLARKESVGKYSFTMTDHSAEVTATLLADNSWDQFPANGFASVDEASKTITITSAAQLGLLAYNVNNGNTYEGWTIELSKESSSDFDTDGNLLMSGHGWVPIGTRQHPFRGTFDGKGLGLRSLITAGTYVDKDYSGLFGYVYNATIKGVKLYNSIFQGGNYVGAIAGRLTNSATITDCYVDESCNIVGSGEYVGGITGLVPNNASVTGCVCGAPVSGVKRVGGLIGQVDTSAKIEDNIYAGGDGDVTASGAQGNGWVSYVIGNINSAAPNIRRTISIASRIVKTINDYDYPAYSVTSGSTGISLFPDTQLTYSTSGITAYENSLDLNGIRYAERGKTLNITLKKDNTSGATFKNVMASSGTLTAVAEENAENSKHTLVLDSDEQSDVVITAIIGDTHFWTEYAAEKFASQSVENKTITIETPEQLALLALNVNSGISYKGYTITLEADIDLKHPKDKNGNIDETIEPHWVPIAANNYGFTGTFDGKGHKISNLTIGDGEVAIFAGLFGTIGGTGLSEYAATVKRVKLSSSSITANSSTGGIVGRAFYYSKIEDCTVDASVTISGNNSLGGIAGFTAQRSVGKAIVSGCISAANVTGTGTNPYNIGGIVGQNDGRVEYCVYNGTQVSGKYNVGACIGRNLNNDSQNVYYINSGYTGTNSKDRFAYTISATGGMTLEVKTTDPVVATVKNFEKSELTFYDYDTSVKGGGFKLGSQLYAGKDEKIYLDVTVSSEAKMWAISANGDANLLKYHDLDYGLNMTDNNGTGWFTLNVGANYTLTATDAVSNFEGVGEEDFPYLIHNKKELYRLAVVVAAGGDDYKDKYFRLENNLEYTGENNYILPIGENKDHPFQGYFDGNNHTISGAKFTSSATSGSEYLGIFGYIKYGKVSHLRLTNSTFAGSTAAGVQSYVGGIVAYSEGVEDSETQITTIYDCQVDADVTLSGKYVGGIVAWMGYDEQKVKKSTVEGCVSAANIEATTCAGGVIGRMLSQQLEVKNCLYTGKSVAIAGGATGMTSRAYCVGSYSESNTSLDIYYTDQKLSSINESDRKGYTVTPIAGIQLAHTESESVASSGYTLTGIHGYKVGLTYGGKFYATKGQTLEFTITSDDGVNTIESPKAIADDSEQTETPLTVTNDKYTFTLGESNYTISCTIAVNWAGAGTQDSPYIIDNIQRMNLLSTRTAAGNNYEGNYFKLTADLDYSGVAEPDGSNFTPIKEFSGKFDGNGHTISGVKISSSADFANVAIFSDLYFGGRVDNLTLEKSTISSTGTYCYVGGIVGYLHGHSFIAGASTAVSNCFVADDVTVSGGEACVGGLVAFIGEGFNLEVEGNVSKAKVSNTSANRGVGGIVGVVGQDRNGTVRYNLYLGDASSVTSTAGGNAHAIIGRRSSVAGAVYNNFFTAAYTANGNESLAYEYDDQTYSGTAIDLPRITKITVYDKNLMKYGGKFYSCYQKGDANGDGVVNITDYVTIVNKIHDKVSGNISNFAADANGDGYINITDAVKVVNTIHGR